MPVDILRQVLDVEGWQPHGACGDPDLAAGANWFPEQNHARDAATERALKVCAGCPVRVECLLFSLVMDRHRDRGIFGGLPPRKRNKLRGIMARAGYPIAMRSCAQCGRRFAASANTPHEKVCCSTACSLKRRRETDRQRSLRTPLSSSEMEALVAALAAGVDYPAGPFDAVPPALHMTA